MIDRKDGSKTIGNGVYASIVTYNPEIDLLNSCIDAVLLQVEKVVIIDNCSSNLSFIHDLLKKYCKKYPGRIAYKYNTNNKGIAYALNQAVRYCKRHGIKWLLTLDQDTIIPEGLVERYSSYLYNDRVGQICCDIENYDDPGLDIIKMSPLTVSYKKTGEVFKVYACITSGSLLNVEACLDVGGFKKDFFIDYVDYEMSLELGASGYYTLYLPDVQISHRFGVAEKKRILGVEFTDYHFSPLRTFYKVRNGIYMIQKYPKHRRVFLKSVIYDIICSIVCLRKECCISAFRGIVAGIKMIVLKK